MAGHSVDEYLETIYFLAFPIGEYRPDPNSSSAIASRVAEMLGVSRASAGEMLKRLEEAEGLVERGEHKEALLTETGSSGPSGSGKHRIIERLLTDFMGYTAAEARARGRARRHVQRRHGRADRGAARHPDRCPRLARRPGVRAGGEQEPRAARRPRDGARSGDRASPSTTASSCTGSTTRASPPGTRVVIRERQPAVAQFRVLLGADSERAIGEKAAAGLYVRAK